MPLAEVVAKLELQAREAARRQRELRIEALRIARNGPANDYEVATLRAFDDGRGS